MLPFSECDEIPVGNQSQNLSTLVNSKPLTGTKFLAPFVPANPQVVREAIAFSSATEEDIVADLGCGDGRILLACIEHGVKKCIAVELDPVLCESIRSDHSHLIQSENLVLIESDFMTVDILSLKITIIILYLLPDALMKLSTKLKQWINQSPERRIVCITFSIHGWKATKGKQVFPSTSSSFTPGAQGAGVWIYYYDASSISTT